METLYNTTITDIIISNSKLWPNKNAYVFLLDGEEKKAELTFKELYHKVACFSKFLSDNNCKKNDRVLLCYPPGLEYVIAFYACLSKGLIAVPIYPPDARNSARVKCIIEDSEARLALTSMLSSEQAEFGLSCEGLSWVSTNFADQEIDEQSQLLNEANADDIAFLQYTSGSTSDPKGVMVTHKNLMANSLQIMKNLHHNANCIFVSWLPPYHDMGLIGSIVQPMYAGMTTVLMAPDSFIKKPIRWIKAISEYGKLGFVTSGGPNFCYEICCNISDDKLQGIDLSNWRIAYNGAEPLRSETLKKFAAKFSNNGFSYQSICPLYGLAEVTLMASVGDIFSEPILKRIKTEAIKSDKIELGFETDKDHLTELVGCGKNLEGQTIRIVNPKTLEKCTDDEIGEIWIKGESVANGYWQNEKATISTFQAYTSDTKEGPFLRTGDLGFFIGTELFVTGRSKELIIIRGQNFYPQDIEKVVEQSNECIRTGAGTAFSVEVEEEEKLVIVYEVQRKYLEGLDLDKLKSDVKKAVSENFQLSVHSIVIIEPSSFPKTTSGKLQRVLVKNMYLKNELKVLNKILELN